MEVCLKQLLISLILVVEETVRTLRSPPFCFFDFFDQTFFPPLVALAAPGAPSSSDWRNDPMISLSEGSK